MNHQILFGVVNVFTSIAVFGIVFYKLIRKPKAFTWVESLGMGLLGAGCIMTIGPLTFKPSPYDDWTIALFRIGCAVYFVGRLTRHRLNNALARKQAMQRVEGRAQ